MVLLPLYVLKTACSDMFLKSCSFCIVLMKEMQIVKHLWSFQWQESWDSRKIIVIVYFHDGILFLILFIKRLYVDQMT